MKAYGKSIRIGGFERLDPMYLKTDWILFKYYLRLLLRVSVFKILPSSFLYKRMLQKHLKEKGRKIYKVDLETPKTFAEKLIWLKTYHRFENANRLVDKFLVKESISQDLGDSYVIPAIATYTSREKIDFNELPDRCVLKPNHGSGWFFIYDRSKGTEFEYYIRKRLEIIMKFDGYDLLWEWQYKGINRKIIVEPYIEELDDPTVISDYKFFCFDGVPKFVQLDRNRHGIHQRSFVDMNWNIMDLRFWKEPVKPLPQMPQNFTRMIELAKHLSKGLIFARIDLYNIKGVIKFGEITLHPGSGHFPFETMKDDLEVGKLLKLPLE